MVTEELREDWYIRNALIKTYLNYFGYRTNGGRILLLQSPCEGFAVKEETSVKIHSWTRHLGVFGDTSVAPAIESEFLARLNAAWEKDEHRRMVKVKFDAMHRRLLSNDYLPPELEYEQGL